MGAVYIIKRLDDAEETHKRDVWTLTYVLKCASMILILYAARLLKYSLITVLAGFSYKI